MVKQSRYVLETRTGKLLDVVSDGFGDIQGLAEEMGEWRDNLEEKLSHTDKFSQVSDAADTLESNSDEPDSDRVSKLLENREISYGEMVIRRKKSRSGPSRSTRFDNAVGRLNAALEDLNELIDSDDISDDDKSALEDYREELQTKVDALDGAVEFPGMYG